MRVAYFGGDWFLGCLAVLEEHGHEICAVFTDGEQAYNKTIRSWAATSDVSVSTTQPDISQMQRLLNDNIDLLFSVEYPWKIPCNDYPFKTVNVHPSMLPHGRGPNPVSWSILNYPEHAGVTLHKLADEFDTGDIILQEATQLSETTNLDDYLLELEEKIPALVAHLCGNFDELYTNAKPQAGGSYWPKLTLNDRKLSWQATASDLSTIIRAFGKFGVVAVIEDTIYLVRDVQCLKYSSQHPPGTLFKEDNSHFYITIKDGLCAIPKAGILERSKLEKKAPE